MAKLERESVEKGSTGPHKADFLERSDGQTFLELLVSLLSNFLTYLGLVGFNPELVFKRIESKRRQNIQQELDPSIL